MKISNVNSYDFSKNVEIKLLPTWGFIINELSYFSLFYLQKWGRSKDWKIREERTIAWHEKMAIFKFIILF